MSTPPPSPLASDLQMEAVERLMQRLCDAADLAGRIAVEHLATGGKRLRARLALAAVEAVGRRRDLGVPWAAACELLHNGTLVHDDLQDGDRQRRGQPTVWVRHGAAQAINAGDLMLILPYLAVGELAVADEVRWHLGRALAAATAAVVRGQASELALAGAELVTRAAYEASVVGKTSALFELPVRGAALIGGRAPADAESLAAPFRALGVLFQMQDDVLDLYGDKGRGIAGSDLYEGKTSCLVVEHLARHPGDRERVLAVLRAPRDETPADAVAHLIERFRDDGALAAVLARIRELRAQTVSHPALAGEPGIGELARELVGVVLAPIAHLGA